MLQYAVIERVRFDNKQPDKYTSSVNAMFIQPSDAIRFAKMFAKGYREHGEGYARLFHVVEIGDTLKCYHTEAVFCQPNHIHRRAIECLLQWVLEDTNKKFAAAIEPIASY